MWFQWYTCIFIYTVIAYTEKQELNKKQFHVIPEHHVMCPLHNTEAFGVHFNYRKTSVKHLHTSLKKIITNDIVIVITITINVHI